MKMPEYLKRRSRFWIEWSCRPPTDMQELFVEIDSVTSTLINCDVMNAVGVYDPESHVGGQFGRTRAIVSVS
jgi:hypothetical protein